ncbi:hypothetical protein AAG570_013789 [Ranatra chinensis]|uniref:Uncharacterized protein n=1 Tax=Ranatra chinensis TaxID=642074 RepID=A0ABD0YD76_9HEMI
MASKRRKKKQETTGIRSCLPWHMPQSFNGLDYLAELLWNRNPRHPDRRADYTKLFDTQVFKECMRKQLACHGGRNGQNKPGTASVSCEIFVNLTQPVRSTFFILRRESAADSHRQLVSKAVGLTPEDVHPKGP